MANKTIGKVAIVKGSQIQRLDDLAAAAVQKIKFIPKIVDGWPATVFKMVQYSYSWEYGWQVHGLSSQQICKPRSVDSAAQHR